MSLSDLFAYYLGANFTYNEELKKNFIDSELYDFLNSERDLIAYTPNSGDLYIKTQNRANSNYSFTYYKLEKSLAGKYIFDGGNILIRNQKAIENSIELVRKHTLNNIHRRLSHHLVIDINYEKLSAVLVNKIGEELILIIESRFGILFIKYDYQDNSFSANFDIDWYTFTEATIEDLYVPDPVKKYIRNNGTKYEYPTSMKEIAIVRDTNIEKMKRYFMN